MTLALLVEQILNGVQLGVMLFLTAAGLTLVFGVMGLINLAHGSLFMTGAFVCAWVAGTTGSFWLGLGAGAPAAAATCRTCATWWRRTWRWTTGRSSRTPSSK